ncbi:hypothetical protein [Leucobacter iarius]|uniref:DUF2975 domain-containing protein n=1 Tax=Leucobacter iarius TaxID=333963 RepID=A0ABN2LBZ9_9MICO
MTIASDIRPSRGDRVALWLFVAVGAVIAIAVAVGAALRIGELLGSGPIRVAAEFIDQRATAPIGPDGSDVEVLLDRAVLRTAVPPIATWAGVIGQLVLVIAFATVILCLILLSRRLSRGRIFGRSSTVLVGTAGITGLIGAAATRFFDNMLANAAVAQVSDYGDVRNAVLSIEPFPFVVAAFAVAIVCTVFVIGERMQRETEGLV